MGLAPIFTNLAAFESVPLLGLQHNLPGPQSPVFTNTRILSEFFKLYLHPRCSINRSKMGLLSSKRGQGSVPSDPATASTPDTTCTKEDQDAWQGMMARLEREISEEGTDNPYRRNTQACLDWVKTYGYPNPGYEIWVFDGVVRCQKKEEAREFCKTIPDYFSRIHECVRVISPQYWSVGSEDWVITRT
ncbi:hypothetical protein F5883DRAFT_539251 [Diaporthe sp. PMI_573]|nr:hypothetical protein F5883DRAFT_539251 [Diaporthaceae sp. PMI_573]